MRRALELAERGLGWTSPNPMVGAVIVKDGRILSEGWHVRCGELHAERHALSRCTEDPSGATIYVTLEPCCHHGRQPPCTDAILASGISRVVIGSPDPNPLVAGKGIEILRSHGLEVTEGVLREECDRLNYVFLHYIRTRRPYVVMKYAMTMDGKIATRTGASQWITGEAARHQVQLDRHRYRAIMAGIGTVLADDPLLTCRLEGYRSPVRVICDSRLQTPPASRLAQTAGEVPTIIATCCTDSQKIRALTNTGCQIWNLPGKDGHVDLAELMSRLGQQEIDSVLLEGGGTLNWSMLRAGLVHRVQAYIAPKLFGGAEAPSPVRGEGVSLPAEAALLENTVIRQIGSDFLLESEVRQNVYGNR